MFLPYESKRVSKLRTEFPADYRKHRSIEAEDIFWKVRRKLGLLIALADTASHERTDTVEMVRLDVEGWQEMQAMLQAVSSHIDRLDAHIATLETAAGRKKGGRK